MEKLINELTPLIEKYNNNNESKITLFELETIMSLLYFYRNFAKENKSNSVYFVVGSFYVYGDVITFINNENDSNE